MNENLDGFLVALCFVALFLMVNFLPGLFL
jgi:hypothetical protein